MKKLLLFAFLFAVALLPACGTVQPPAESRTEVIWLVRQDANEQQWQAGVISDFESKFPEITIRLEVVAPENFDNRMQVMAAAGTPPDVFSPAGTLGFLDIVTRDLAADLTPFIERDAFDLADFVPPALSAVTVDGRVYGLPVQIAGTYVFYNMDLFDQAGVAYPPANWDAAFWNYEAFLEKCAALTSISGRDPGVYGCNLDLHPADAVAWMWGQDLYPEEAYQTGFADTAFLDQPAVIDAFQARQDIVWKLGYMPDPEEAEMLGGGDLFAAQKVAMQLSGGWGWQAYRDLRDFRWGVAALPYTTEGRRAVLFTEAWTLYSKSKHPEEGWTFLKYLSEAPQQRSWMAATGAPPARISLGAEWFAMFPSMEPANVERVHLGALARGRESPENRLVRFDLLDAAVSEAVVPVIRNEKDAADTLPEANPRLIQALKQIRAEYQKPPTPTPTPTASPTPEPSAAPTETETAIPQP